MKSYKKLGLFFLILLGIVGGIFFYKKEKNTEKRFGYQYLIGLSLPNTTITRNSQLIRSVNKFKEVDKETNILVKEAQDSAEQQIKDVVELEKHGIDLLIIYPIIDKNLMEKLRTLEIPIIILNEREAVGVADAYIEYDNVNAGALLANHINKRGGEKTILLLTGSENDTVSKERERGFLENIEGENKKNIEILQCGWSRNEAENNMKAYLVSGKQVSIVVALNDQMAYGAYLACKKLRVRNVSHYGMNGFDGKNQGLDLVDKRILRNTVQFEDLYEAMKSIALDILKDKEYEKERRLEAFLAK